MSRTLLALLDCGSALQRVVLSSFSSTHKLKPWPYLPKYLVVQTAIAKELIVLTVRCVTCWLCSSLIQRIAIMVHVLSWEDRFKTCSKHWEDKAFSDLFQIWIYTKMSDKISDRWGFLSRSVRMVGLLGFFFLPLCCGSFWNVVAKLHGFGLFFFF